jgi:hypothetical protein
LPCSGESCGGSTLMSPATHGVDVRLTTKRERKAGV